MKKKYHVIVICNHDFHEVIDYDYEFAIVIVIVPTIAITDYDYPMPGRYTYM